MNSHNEAMRLAHQEATAAPVSTITVTPPQLKQDTIWHHVFSRFASFSLRKEEKQLVNRFIQSCYSYGQPLRFPGEAGDETARDAVGAIFDKRSLRKEALINCKALLDNTSFVKIQFLNSVELDAVEDELKFALFQYLAQRQAAQDNLDPAIRTPKTELIRCFLRIERCARLLKYVALRKSHLEVEASQKAAQAQDDGDAKQTLKQKIEQYNELKNELHAPIPLVENLNPNRYDLFWQSENLIMQKGRLYLSVINGKIAYSVITPFGFEIKNEITDIDAPSEFMTPDFEDLDLRKIDYNLKNEILAHAAKKEHILRRNAVRTLLPAFLVNFFGKDEDQSDPDFTIAKLSAGNGIRLFWVWTRCMIESIVETAHQDLLASTIVAAYVSFLLYWVRGGIVIFGGILHVFFPSLAEAVIPFWDRLFAQVDERLDEALNDGIWGTGNFATCFWLLGPTVLGFIGDLITGVLLIMDLSLAARRYEKGLIDYHHKMNCYADQLDIITGNISSAVNQVKENATLQDSLQGLLFILDEIKRNKNKQINLDLQPFDLPFDQLKQHAYKSIMMINALLLEEKKRLQHGDNLNELAVSLKRLDAWFKQENNLNDRWYYDHATLFFDVCYAVALFVAFSMMVGFYLHLLHLALPVSVVIIGAGMLCVSTILWRTARAFFERDAINHTALLAQQNEAAYHRLLQEFIALDKAYRVIEGNKIDQEQSLQRQALLCPDESTEQLQRQILLAQYELNTIDCKMRQLYLDMLATGVHSGEQYEAVQYKGSQLGRTTLLRVLVPIAVALLLAFAPPLILSAPAYVFLLIGIIVLAVASAYFIDYLYKPGSSVKWQKGDDEGKLLPYFNSAEEKEYEAFKGLVFKDCDAQVKAAAVNKPSDFVEQEQCMKNGANLLEQIKCKRTGNGEAHLNLSLFRKLRGVSVDAADDDLPMVPSMMAISAA